MSPSPSGSTTTPLSYRLYRAAIVLVFALVLVVTGLGAAGHGPAQALGKPASEAIAWSKQMMGITAPVADKNANKKKNKKGKNKKGKNKKSKRSGSGGAN